MKPIIPPVIAVIQIDTAISNVNSSVVIDVSIAIFVKPEVNAINKPKKPPAFAPVEMVEICAQRL